MNKTDLISRSALLKHIDECIHGDCVAEWKPVLYAVRCQVVVAPAVDAVPVVHGRWEFEVTKEFGCRYHNFAVKAKCSECGKKRPAWYGAFPHLDDEEAELAALVNAAAQKHPKFCEECGAKMDGGNDG